MKADRVFNVLFCGVGGQGVLTASEVLGVAAMTDGFRVRKSEVHGMSQRGGSVESHLRFGAEVYSPLIPRGEADVLVGLDPGEAERWRDFLRPGGVDLTPCLDAARQAIDQPRLVNTFMLGVLSRHLPLSEASWQQAMTRCFRRAIEDNRRAFALGRAQTQIGPP